MIVRPFVCPSVCNILAPNSIPKTPRRTVISVNILLLRNNGCALNFSLKVKRSKFAAYHNYYIIITMHKRGYCTQINYNELAKIHRLPS